MSVDNKRRDLLKKAAYVAPAILTLSAIPSIAQSGSGYNRGERHGGRFNHDGGGRWGGHRDRGGSRGWRR